LDSCAGCLEAALSKHLRFARRIECLFLIIAHFLADDLVGLLDLRTEGGRVELSPGRNSDLRATLRRHSFLLFFPRVEMHVCAVLVIITLPHLVLRKLPIGSTFVYPRASVKQSAQRLGRLGTIRIERTRSRVQFWVARRVVRESDRKLIV
jgi:hypothetical protein